MEDNLAKETSTKLCTFQFKLHMEKLLLGTFSVHLAEECLLLWRLSRVKDVFVQWLYVTPADSIAENLRGHEAGKTFRFRNSKLTS